MKSISLLIAAVLGLGLMSCENATVTNAVLIANRENEASGSPFHMVAKSVHGGTAITREMIELPRGSSKADGVLKKDILGQIEKMEISKRRSAPEIEDIRLLPDGREVWILKNKDGIAYIVSLRPASAGGTDFTIDGPQLFEKKG